MIFAFVLFVFVSRCSLVFFCFFLFVLLFVLSHNIIFFVMHIVFLLLSSFCFCCFGILSIFEFGLSKHLSEIRKIRNPQMKNAAKNRHLDKSN